MLWLFVVVVDAVFVVRILVKTNRSVYSDCLTISHFSLVSDDSKSNIKDKLLKFITRRPTIDELEKQGILKGI